MAETKTAKKTAKKKTAKPPAQRSSSSAFSAEERAAMKETARERKASQNREEGERLVLAKIKEMPEPDRSMAKRLHEIVAASAPELSPRTWYGMPAYTKDDKVVCFFKAASKFKSRYATIGFEEKASIDDGDAWPVAWAVSKLTPKDEAKFVRLVKKGSD